MTVPCERYRAVEKTRDFLTKLLRTKDAMVPKWVRHEAYDCIKHYPGSFSMGLAREADSYSWGKKE